MTDLFDLFLIFTIDRGEKLWLLIHTQPSFMSIRIAAKTLYTTYPIWNFSKINLQGSVNSTVEPQEIRGIG